MIEPKEKRRVVLGITGSIAAYKAAELARLLVTEGYEVRVVMSESATQFITPLTLQAVTGNPVTTEFWNESDVGIGHIQLADWADAIVVAPATADTIAKIAHGFSETPLLAIILATKSPVLLAPAMNVNMFEHPVTQENIRALRERGVRFVEPETGALACGWNGTGRLAAPAEIFSHLRRVLAPQDFAGKHVVITTGPTREAIDPVRFLSNRSSGKMGTAIAIEAFRRGAEVTLIHGPVPITAPDVITRIPVVSAEEMKSAVMGLMAPKKGSPIRPADVVVMTAAVADYRVVTVAKSKLKRSGKPPALALAENPDILRLAGEARKRSRTPILVGFAVETGEIDELVAEVRRKLKTKQVDVMVGNRADDAFDLDTNRVWILDRNGREEEVATASKSRIATKVLDAVLKL